MALCKDCLHNEVCKYGENRSNGMYCTGEKCKQFKSAADVVEVVRCKDCSYCRYVDGAGIYRCDRRGYYSEEVKPTDFCSYGERRTE
jgi:hypothetical protein